MSSIQKKIISKVLEVILIGFLIPELEKYVAQTDNQFDDQLVQGVKSFVKNILEKLK